MSEERSERSTSGRCSSTSEDDEHVPSENEAWYDEEIAPVLFELGKKCIERGMSLVACCEFDRASTGGTYCIHENASIKVRMAELASRSAGNADILIRNLLEWGKRDGHNSVYLRLLEER